MANRYWSQEVTRFSLNLLLQVDASLIATDIATGFPYLLAIKRRELEEIIHQSFKTYLAGRSHQVDLDQGVRDFPKQVKETLAGYLAGQPLIQLDSIEFDISWMI
ncbi:hypothetical protein ACWOBX_05565 [Facklamia languida]